MTLSFKRLGGITYTLLNFVDIFSLIYRMYYRKKKNTASDMKKEHN